MDCELCHTQGGELLWQDERCRVVLVADANYPGYCRVVWNAHVAEMSDLPANDRRHVMAVVDAVEVALRQCLQPDKINLASFGNMTPHVHWHVIPRWRDDPHFPQPIWGAVQRTAPPVERPRIGAAALARLISAAVSGETSGGG